MTWITWRQFRAQGITAAALIAAVGAVLLVSGLSLAHSYSVSVASCGGPRACASAANGFINQMKGTPTELIFYAGIVLVYLAPAFIGMFWGAPLLARELEAGTLRLAWNQSVSRTRWMVAKLGLVGLAAMTTAGLLSLFTGWWAAPVYRAADLAGLDSFSFTRLAPPLFGAQGIVPVGYAAFAFALGVTAGLLFRRTIPAMAVTLAGFGLIQLAWPNWIRPRLVTPLREYFPITPANFSALVVMNNTKFVVQRSISKAGAWVVSNQTVGPAGRPFSGPPTRACLNVNSSPGACSASIGPLHLRALISYVPAGRFWGLQWIEVAVYLLVAAALAWFCVLRVRRRSFG